MIEGVKVVPLRKIPDERGAIYHMLRVDSDHFTEFGEIYFSKAYPGVIKGWHIHKRQTQNYAVPLGMIKLVIYDIRENSTTTGELMELFIGDDNYCLVQMPPGVANGYKCIGTSPALVANCTDEPHTPDEMDRIDPFNSKVPYDWALVHK